MKLLRRRALGVAAGLIVTALFAWLLLAGLDLAAVRDAAAGASLSLLAASVLVRACTFGLVTARSVVVFREVAPMPARTHLEGLVISFVGNTVLPFRMGMLMRVAHLSRQSKHPPERILGAVASERLVDLSVLLSLALIMAPSLVSAGAAPMAVTAAALLLAAVFTVLILAAPRAEQIAQELPDALAERFLGLFIGIRTLGSARRLVPTVALTAAFWSGQALCIMLWLAAFDLPASPWAAAAFLVLVAFGAMIPSGPAFSGPWHYFAAKTAALTGAGEVKAAAFALVAHATAFLPLTVVGLTWLWTRFLNALQMAGSEE